MAANLVKAGFNVSVYNRDRAKAAPFEEKGCGRASTPAELAKRCDVVITMVSDPTALDAVLEGPTGVFSAGFAGCLLMNMSTVSVEYTRRLMKRCFEERVKFIDCPVSGSRPLAENGTLVLLAGGEAEDIEAVRPALSAMGKAVVLAGPAPGGTALKLCVNLIIAGVTSALAESAALAGTLGLDPRLIFSVLSENPALNCAYFRMKERNILEGDFAPAFALKHMLKDVRFMLKEAGGRGQALPVTAAIEKLMSESERAGDGEMDLTVIHRRLSRRG